MALLPDLAFQLDSNHKALAKQANMLSTTLWSHRLYAKAIQKCVCVCVFVFFLLPHSPGSGSWKLKYWLKSPLLMRDTSKIRIKKKQDNKKQWISILLLFWGLYLSMWSWLLLWFCMIKKASEIIYIVKHSLSVEMRFFFINIRRTDFSRCTSLCEAKTIKTGHL